MISKLYVATNNSGKLKEIIHGMEGIGIEITPFNITFGNELQLQTLAEISKDKARQAFEAARAPIITDDAGIYIEKYNNFPGVNAKYIIESIGIDGIKRLVDEGSRVSFQAAISYMDESLPDPMTFIGVTSGVLSLKDDLQNMEAGFPFNSLFIPDGAEKFMYQISVEDRQQFSHRLRAVQQLAEYLKTR